MEEDPVKDKRIVELNDIVEEVKESEEWEAVKMNILEIGIEKGIEQGELAKSLDVAKNLLALGMPVSQIMQVTGLTKEQISSLLVK